MPKGTVGSLAYAVQRFLAALGLLVIVVTATPLVRWWAFALAGPWEDPGGDVLIVLGGSAEDDGAIGESSFRRSQYGALVFKEGRFKEMLLSGGSNGGGPSIAEAMRDYLICLGIPAQAIHLEPYSRNTRENALFAKDTLAVDYHLLLH